MSDQAIEVQDTDIQMGGDLGALFGALAKAQADMAPAIAKAINPQFKSKYADLGEVLGCIEPALNKHGLCLSQHPGWADGMPTMVTIIGHVSGGWMASKASSPLGRGSGPQALGSALTYLRRYASSAICGLPSGTDDDGNAAQASFQKQPPKKKAAPAPAPKPLPEWTAKERAAFHVRRKEPDIGFEKDVDYEVIKQVCKNLDRPMPKHMTTKQRTELLVWLASEKAKKHIEDAETIIDYHTHARGE
jgi:hypothetical protein